MTTKLFAAAALLGSALAGAVVWEGGPDAVVYPPQDVPIYFTHDYHTRKPSDAKNEKGEAIKLEGEGLACDFCHENVSSSTRSADRDIPGHGACDTCHEEWIGEKGKDEPADKCIKCHTDPEVPNSTNARAKLTIFNPNIRFPHKWHIDAGVNCTDCHTNVPKKTVATRDDYPTMDRCIGCHKEKGVSTKCQTCHLTQPSGRLQLEFAEGKLAPRRLHSFAIHDRDFLRDHAVPAKRDKAYCNNCHAEDDCLACHDGVARNVRYHPGDWLAMHHIRAKKDDYRCQACHHLQTFCLDCHVRSGVATVGLGTEVGLTPGGFSRRTIRQENGIATGPHPMAADGWYDPASRNFHGFFAQRNIRTCASCHQEQFCIVCHLSQGSSFGRFFNGGNPHGPNPERLKGGTASKHTARMCLKCHSPMDPSWR